MAGIKKTISLFGIILLFLCSLPAAALTVDDYKFAGENKENTHLEQVVERQLPAEDLVEGSVICTSNHEECFVKHTESGASAILENTAVLPTQYAEISEPSLVESTEPFVTTEAPQPVVEVSEPITEEPAPVQIIKQIIYLPAEQTTVENLEISPEPTDGVVLSPEIIDSALNLAVQIPTETLGLADFGFSNVFHSTNATGQGDDSNWVIYWSLIAVLSYGVTLFTFRAALVERGKAELEEAVMVHHKIKKVVKKHLTKKPRLRLAH